MWGGYRLKTLEIRVPDAPEKQKTKSDLKMKRANKGKKKGCPISKKSKKCIVLWQKTTQSRLRKRERMLCPQYTAGNCKKY